MNLYKVTLIDGLANTIDEYVVAKSVSDAEEMCECDILKIERLQLNITIQGE